MARTVIQAMACPRQMPKFRPAWPISDTSGNEYIGGLNVIRIVNATGIINTFAGNGIPAFAGDGEPASVAQFKGNAGMCRDNQGNIYVADMVDERIRRIDTGDTITTIAGTGTAGFSGDGGPASAARFNYPNDIIADRQGNLYITDLNNNRVRRIDTSGTITTIAGNGTPGYSGDGGPATAAELSHPSRVAIDCAGDLYINDGDSSRIRVVLLQHPPFFTGGHAQSITLCEDTLTPINSLLAAIDSDVGQTAAWSLAVPAAHGTAMAAWSTTTTGGLLTPGGLSYSPTAGFTGADSFRVRVSDCGFLTDHVTVYVAVVNCALGVGNAGRDDISLYPNPAGGELNIEAPFPIRIVSVCNSLGQVLETNYYDAPAVRVSIADLPPGMYFVKINGGGVRKFVKE